MSIDVEFWGCDLKILRPDLEKVRYGFLGDSVIEDKNRLSEIIQTNCASQMLMLFSDTTLNFIKKWERSMQNAKILQEAHP